MRPMRIKKSSSETGTLGTSLVSGVPYNEQVLRQSDDTQLAAQLWQAEAHQGKVQR